MCIVDEKRKRLVDQLVVKIMISCFRARKLMETNGCNELQVDLGMVE